ncbi:carbohydrate ABC transporter substrate-binding protein [Pleurocapsales cyanobacterium LEGE 10410]|nr:carbohydrate ABC transporter substrate-binding protein [Pleurocapsales cyanobacterium LEGE 10410]
MKKRWGYWLIASAIATILIAMACSNQTELDLDPQQNPLSETNELEIWWERGYNLEEDEAIRNVVNNWQSQTGNRVKLDFFSSEELTAKAKRADEAGNLPDLMMNPQGDRLLYPQLAWQNKLVDVTDLIKPIEDDYPEHILRAITYSNSAQAKPSYYAVPINQITIFIFYWQDLLAAVGLNADDIPQDWNGFWRFWQQAQTQLKTQQNLDIYALGLPLSGNNSANDTIFLFEQVLEAYDVALFDQRGELQIERPEVRQGIINCLSWYAQMYQQGYIPPDATQWMDTDNNRSLLNRSVLMTPNATLSIPATVRSDRDVYYKRLGILQFPHKPNGEPIRPLVSVRQAVIFQDSAQQSLAKDFLNYFIQPQIAINYFKASNSRTYPVRNSICSAPFWQNTEDPYLKASKVLSTKSPRLFYTVDHPAYSQVLAENIWGKALIKVTSDRLNPEQAADEAIARIKEIAAEWSK